MLREWLKDGVNRNIVLDMERLWHGPDIIALLSCGNTAAARGADAGRAYGGAAVVGER